MSFYIKKVLLVIFIISSFSVGQNYGTWSLTDSLNFPRENAASVELANGNILISGGVDSIYLREAEIYDYKLEKWENINPMVVGRAYHKLIRLNNGNILAIGGGFENKSCEIYDITTKTWSLTDSLNYERTFGETATLLDNGNVLVVGGFYTRFGTIKYLSKCEIYDINIAQWTIIDSLKIPREYHTTTKLQDGRVLVTGGYGGSIYGDIKECEIYNPQTGKWGDVASLNVGRTEHSANLLYSGAVLITGGENDTNPTNPWLNSCEIYDPKSNTWTLVNSLFVPHTYHFPVLLNNNLLLIAGGGLNSDVWELYNTNDFSNVYMNYYPSNQGIPLINLLPNGKVLSASGFTWKDTLGNLIRSSTSMCYLYDPDGISTIEQPENDITGFKLYPNYPNPFNPTTTIKYEIPKTTHVLIKIYNTLGKEINILINKTQAAGIYTINFNSKGLSSGVYFYQIITDRWAQINKMLLIK